MKTHSKVTLTWTEPGGSKTKISYTTEYLEAATRDVFQTLYRALNLTEFMWLGEPEQSDVDYLQKRVDRA